MAPKKGRKNHSPSTPAKTSGSSSPDRRNSRIPPPPTTPPPSPPSRIGRLGHLLIHLLCLLFYLLPMLTSSHPQNRGLPVLDELHIVSHDNKDVNGESTWQTIFSNDYWGRPMSSPSSHKSWRPLTILSFRYLKGGDWLTDLQSHRLVNVFLHACIAELVAILTVKLLPNSFLGHNPIRFGSSSSWRGADVLHVLTKLLFALHPTHVEVTANAANRGHLLGVLCSVLAADPDIPWWLFVMTILAGFLSSETFLFQILPAAVTLSSVHYVRAFHNKETKRQLLVRTNGKLPSPFWTQLRTTVLLVWPRGVTLVLGAVTYYSVRRVLDTLSIPEGLIRPAENPFFQLTGWIRVWSYSYVLAIHVAKAWAMDFVGFSHEYGHECIRPVVSAHDVRLYVPGGLFVFYFLTGVWFLFSIIENTILFAKRNSTSFTLRPVVSIPALFFVMHLAWLTTLFPVSGFVKVGTFVSDRIVVAVSVSTCQIVATGFVAWLKYRTSTQSVSRRRIRDTTKVISLLVFLLFLYWKVYHRSLEWMDSLPLLSSSIKVCPRFAKAHLELSKIYSGLYDDQFNLSTSRRHIELAEAFDPDYCDVHQQYAYVAAQEHRYRDFEESLSMSLLCPYTMGQAIPLWENYWKEALNEEKSPREQVIQARKRYSKYNAIIQDAIAKESD